MRHGSCSGWTTKAGLSYPFQLFLLFRVSVFGEGVGWMGQASWFLEKTEFSIDSRQHLLPCMYPYLLYFVYIHFPSMFCCQLDSMWHVLLYLLSCTVVVVY